MTKGLKLITKVVAIRMPLITFNMYKPIHPGMKLAKHSYNVQTGEGIIRLSGLTFNPDSRLNITQKDMDEELSRISKFIIDDNPRRTEDNKRPINKPTDFWSKNIALTSIPGLSNQFDYIQSRMITQTYYYAPKNELNEIKKYYEKNRKIYDSKPKIETFGEIKDNFGNKYVKVKSGEVN